MPTYAVVCICISKVSKLREHAVVGIYNNFTIPELISRYTGSRSRDEGRFT